MAAQSLKKGTWQQFKQDEPGHRFMNLRKRRQQSRKSGQGGEKCVNMIGGGLVAAVGLVLMPAPGPGILIFAAGMALLGTEFELIAKLMDRAEVNVREWTAEAKQARRRFRSARSRSVQRRQPVAEEPGVFKY